MLHLRLQKNISKDTIFDFLKKIKIYTFLKILYHTVKNYLFYIFYNEKNDLNYNLTLLKKIKLKKNRIIKVLKDNNYNFFDELLSWHYHLFAGLQKERVKILEIGTHIGEFTYFMSNIFKKSKIYTIDLTPKKISLSIFIKKRKVKYYKKNIFFYNINSFDILKKFKREFFDIIYVDGDHSNPVVSWDVISSFYLLKKKGVLISDDIIANNAGFLAINYLTKIKKLETFYFIKRVYKKNSFQKKYISYSVKI